MEIDIPDNFIKVESIQKLLETLNYKRDNWYNADKYILVHNKETFAIEILSGKEKGFYVHRSYLNED